MAYQERIVNIKKNQCEEAVVMHEVVVQHCCHAMASRKRICEYLKNDQCEEVVVVVHEEVAQHHHCATWLTKKESAHS